MKLSEFDYNLPENLIAQTPILKRDESRLLVVDRKYGDIEHKSFKDVIDYLEKDDCLVINNTKVIPARLIGIKQETMATIELLLLKNIKNNIWECLAKPAKRLQIGTVISFGNDLLKARVIKKLNDGITHIELIYNGILMEILDKLGEMPLPPYIHEKVTEKARYQTVYAKNEGSAAAPTAGLHFTNELLTKIKSKGVKIVEITLHVGLGTFRPVQEEDVSNHHMHSEYYEIDQNSAEILNATKRNNHRIIAVGTTSVRTLEANYKKHGEFKAEKANTEIFITPGFKFEAVDGIITNFHLPKSTLIMLVSAFSKKKTILTAYEKAVIRNYRFFSFGDAMYISNVIDYTNIVKKFANDKQTIINGDDFKIYQGTNNIIISVPHAYKHTRNNNTKKNEYNTVNLTKILHYFTGCHIIYKYKDSSKDANYIEDDVYRKTLACYIKENKIKYLLDIHGCDNHKGYKIEIGTNKYKNVLNNIKLVTDLVEIFNKNIIDQVVIDKRFKAGTKTIANYINKECSICAMQFEIKQNLRKLKKRPATFNKCVNAFREIIKYLEEIKEE